MASKVYTAQEMRGVAQCLHYNSPTALTIEASAMLLQAAEMRERCEEIKVEQPFDSVINTANYILRGDAGKEER